MPDPVYEQNTCAVCDRVFHLKSQWLGKILARFARDVYSFSVVLDHLKSKLHKRMLRENQRKTFRRNLNNAIPNLLNTLDELQTRKMQEEGEGEERKNDSNENEDE